AAIRPADSATLITVELISLSTDVQVNSVVEHPAAKKTPFQAECVTTENQPFPLTHVRKLKKSDGNTKSKLPNARLLIDRVSVLSKCIATHTAPVARRSEEHTS